MILPVKDLHCHVHIQINQGHELIVTRRRLGHALAMHQASLHDPGIIHSRLENLDGAILEVIVDLDLAHQIGCVVDLLEGLLEVAPEAEHLLVVGQPGRHPGTRARRIDGSGANGRTANVHRHAARVHRFRLLAIAQHAESLELQQGLGLGMMALGDLIKGILIPVNYLYLIIIKSLGTYIAEECARKQGHPRNTQHGVVFIFIKA